MIELVLQIAMSTVLLCGTIAVGISLLRMHRAQETPSLNDLITSTNKKGRVFLDPRKCFEIGAFIVSTWAFVYLVLATRMTEWYFGGYMMAWVGARFLRDREKRLAAAK